MSAADRLRARQPTAWPMLAALLRERKNKIDRALGKIEVLQ